MTTLDIVPRLPAHEHKQSALRVIEQAMQRIESGETVTVAVVEVSRDGATYVNWSLSDNINILLGGMSRLSHRINTYLESKR